MPSTYDNTYHYQFSKPTYDREFDEKVALEQRIADEIFELQVPRLPTKEEEREYMDFLAEDFRSDPWASLRFHKYMAGPKRIPWKN